MTDSSQDLPERQPLPPAIQIGPQAQYAAVALLLSGAVGTVTAALSLFFNTVVGVMVVISQLVALSQVSGSDLGIVLSMTAVGVVFGLSFLFPLATSLGGIYGGYTLYRGGDARHIRAAAIGNLVGHGFMILGSVPGLIFGGCTSFLVLLSSPLLAIVSVAAAVLAFVAVREGELIQQDAASERLETP